MELPARNSNIQETVLMYGHLDKQPPMGEDWDKNLGGEKKKKKHKKKSTKKKKSIKQILI